MKLTISNLSKTYKNGVKALDNVDLELSIGMFGLLGPNGAGKSTLMRTIATLQNPDTGSIYFNDIDVLKDPMSLRKKLGYLPQEFGVYPKISALRLLHYFATLKGVVSTKQRSSLVDYVLDITNLTEVSKKAVSTYSGGMKQRFGIAQLLLNNPELIIVDEPTAGLDPAERKRFLNILREIGANHIVIFSTHIVDDVKGLCTDMAILNEGRVLLRKAPADATGSLESKVWIKDISREELETLEANYQVISSNYKDDNSVQLKVYAIENPGEGFSKSKPHLEDAYFVALNNYQ